MTRKTIKPITEQSLYNRLGWAYKAEVEHNGCVFRKTENLCTQLSNIARLLINNKRWGLLVRGVVGNGKTTAVNALRHVINNLVEEHYFSAGELFRWDWMQVVDAEEMVNRYIRNRDGYEYIKTCEWLVIDDLGVEPAKVNMYGTDFFPFRELFNYRYKRRLPTVITSNFKKEELKQIYVDERFSDRLNEMFNTTTFRDNSFRI